MNSPFIIPLGVFLAVVLIVGIVVMARLHDSEADTVCKLEPEEREHARRMRELEEELQRVKQGK